MRQKTWVIPEENWGRSLADILDSDSPQKGNSGAKRAADETPQKNPALAFSLSLLLWGSGQLYLRHYRLGALALAAMLSFYAALTSVLLYWPQIHRFWDATALPMARLLLGLALFLVIGLCLWLANAVHAYRASITSRTEAFNGVGRPGWSLLCSAVLPGWGQFLNGQGWKGACLLPVGGLAILALSLLWIWPSVWPLLETSADRTLFEVIFASGLLVLPLCFLLWLVAMHDAMRCCRRPLHAVLPNVRTAMRKKNVLRRLLPGRTALLILLLALSVVVLTMSPHYYGHALRKLRREMIYNDMQIVPELLDKALDLTRQLTPNRN